MSNLACNDNGGEVLLYQSEDGQTRVEVRLVGETLWLTATDRSDTAATRSASGTTP